MQKNKNTKEVLSFKIERVVYDKDVKLNIEGEEKNINVKISDEEMLFIEKSLQKAEKDRTNPNLTEDEKVQNDLELQKIIWKDNLEEVRKACGDYSFKILNIKVAIDVVAMVNSKQEKSIKGVAGKYQKKHFKHNKK